MKIAIFCALLPLIGIAAGACTPEAPCTAQRAEGIAFAAAKAKFPQWNAERKDVHVRDLGDRWEVAYFYRGALGGAPIVTVGKAECTVLKVVSTQ